MKVSTILDSIDQGNVALPEFQRGYVWKRQQVRDLLRSLYRRYPVGGLLVWETRAEATATRGAGAGSMLVKLLLDGQQRITTLYGLMRGHPPTFFQGDANAFTGVYFHLEDEAFEFYGPVKMRADPRWVDVTELFKTGLSPWFARLGGMGLESELLGRYSERLNRILGIADIDLHLDEITPGLGIDEIVDIFNQVNSGGTTLSKGDLALARICAAWPDGRSEMVGLLNGWREHGYEFTLDWLLRVTNAVLTGEAQFAALKDATPAAFQDALWQASATVDDLLNLLSGRLGLDHHRVLGGRYAFPVLARYWAGAAAMTDADRGQLLYWYLNAALWGRHSGSTESMLDQDLDALDRGGLDGLIAQLRVWRGDLTLRPENLAGSELGSRFYPLVYLLARVFGARDLGSGNPLSRDSTRRLSGLELHYVFPKALLQDHGFDRAARNAIANYCFLTAGTGLAIGNRPPAEYLPECEARNPGVLASQWIPADPDLWHPERYPDFLDARRDLLSSAANDFLDGLLVGAGPPSLRAAAEAPPSPVVMDPVALRLTALAAEAGRLGLAPPEIDHEIVDADSGEVLAWADLAWPAGVQTGLTQPVAYLAEPDEDLQGRLGELGWRFFTGEGALRRYFEEVLGIDLDGDGVVGSLPELPEQPDGPAKAGFPLGELPVCWLVRAGKKGGVYAPDFERLGVIAIGFGFPGLGDLRDLDDERVLALLEEARRGQPVADLGELRGFQRELRRGDIVLTPSGGELLVGFVEGDYDYVDDPPVGDYRHVRLMRWLGRCPRDIEGHTDVYLRTVRRMPEAQQASWRALAEELARDDLRRPRPFRSG